MSWTSSTISSGDIDRDQATVLAQTGRAVAERLRENPAVIAIPHDGIEMFVVPDFISPAECAALIEKIDAVCQPSTLLSGGTLADDVGFRTSHSANLDRFDPLVEAIDTRILALTGLRERQGETIQGQRYRQGQLFKPHYDWFGTDQPYWPKEAAAGGQRSWTTMAYLNRPEAGGATRFTSAGFQVEPLPGLLLLWNNMTVDGLPNPAVMHEGSPVEAGTKYIFTKWFRRGDWY
jgi:prolyl 4-hydroxylase